VFDSVSVVTTFRDELKKAGVLFCSISEAIREYPEIVKKFLRLGRAHDRQLLCDAELGGVFRRLVRLHPRGRPLPDGTVDLLPHQRANTGQFERTLIIAEKGAYVSYLEGCTAPMRDETSSTPPWSNWSRWKTPRSSIRPSRMVSGDANGKGGITTSSPSAAIAAATAPRFRGPVETGSAITWKYPSVILRGDDSVGEFYSIAVSNGHQQIDRAPR
jgi:Fe-S cluster assembly protein SufB